jgi:hypothetical protein
MLTFCRNIAALELDKFRRGRDNPFAADWRALAHGPIYAVLLTHMRTLRDRGRVKLMTNLQPGENQPDDSPSDWIFHPRLFD